jgi:hypothetical protein
VKGGRHNNGGGGKKPDRECQDMASCRADIRQIMSIKFHPVAQEARRDQKPYYVFTKNDGELSASSRIVIG